MTHETERQAMERYLILSDSDYRRILAAALVVMILMGACPPWRASTPLLRGGPVERPIGYSLIVWAPSDVGEGSLNSVTSVRIDRIATRLGPTVPGCHQDRFRKRRRDTSPSSIMQAAL